MPSVVRSELTKILTLPSVRIVTVIVLALQTVVLLQPVGLISDAVQHITPAGIIEIFRGQPEPAEAGILGLLGASSLQSGLFLPMIAAVIGGHEFRTGQLGVSVLSVPQRGILLAGKVVAAALYMLAVAVVIAGLSTAFLYLAVKDWNPGLLVSGEALTLQARFVAFAVLFSLTSLAVTLLARSTLVGVVVTVVLILVTMSQAFAGFARDVDALFPLSAARNLLLDPVVNTLTASPGNGLVVLIGWAVVSVAGAGAVLARRDAR